MREDEDMTLTEFLLARIAEDEETASNWSRFEIRDGIPGSYGIRERVLAECEAKRVAVDWYEHDDDIVMGPTVRAMAAIWADHPDYDESPGAPSNTERAPRH